jgi:tetratricopeptide (TPR) repeat protein
MMVTVGSAQEDEATRANALWRQGKKLDTLPLYEDLCVTHPKEYLFAERLAGALAVKAEFSSDPAEVKALRTRERDAAKRAVELGDPEYYVKLMAQINPDDPALAVPANSAMVSFNDAEKAYGVGDFAKALVEYAQAADADPNMYAAPLFAGDSAYAQKDLPTAVKWFARAVAIDPNRETAYRYWGDVLLRVGNNPVASKPKYLDAIVAEPYNKLAWNGITYWAHIEQAVIMAPKIERPTAPETDSGKPNNITIHIDPDTTDEKKHPGAAAWITYSLVRASYRGDEFKKNFPNEKEYRHTLKEEDAALTVVAKSIKDLDIKTGKLDESLRNLVDLYDAGMLDCWILINGADNGIAMDYASYRNEHRQLLHDYLDRFVVHGGVNPK